MEVEVPFDVITAEQYVHTIVDDPVKSCEERRNGDNGNVESEEGKENRVQKCSIVVKL